MHLSSVLRWLFCGAFCRLSFGGGGGDSSQRSDTTNSNTTNTTDRRTVADGGSTVVGDGSVATITTTDFNAIQAGHDLGQAAIVGATKLAADANVSAAQLAAKSLATADNALGQLAAAYQSANEQAQGVASGNKTLAIVGVLALALVGFELMTKKGKA